VHSFINSTQLKFIKNMVAGRLKETHANGEQTGK